MINVEKLRDQLLHSEGIRLKPYKDTVGKLTIGIGRNLADVGITREEAFYLLENDIKRTIAAIQNKPWFTCLAGDEVRSRVVIDMAFNMGVGTLETFKETLRAIQAHDYKLASERMLMSLWAKQVGDRAKRLAKMMRTGVDIDE